MSHLTLLGPQSPRPTAVETFDRLGLRGQVAAVTAGWQEREAEVDEMHEHLARPVVDLELHRRCEEVFAQDQELFLAHRARQDRLRKMQRLYRYRLDFTLEPARELLRREDEPELLGPEQDAAVDAVRRLDREHLTRISQVHHDFERRYRPLERDSVVAQREEIGRILRDSDSLAIAGGHVAVLTNRLRLLAVAELLDRLPIVAWSAGAMALSKRLVLFHDSPPWGAGNAEVLDEGLGVYRGLVALPHAARRLQLDDPHRVSLLARRFAPDRCVALDEGTSVSRQGDGWRTHTAARQLMPRGALAQLEAA